MPLFYLTTNVKPTDTKAFVEEFLDVISKLFEFPYEFLTINFNYDEFLLVNGKFDPGYSLRVDGIAKIDHEYNDKHTPVIADFLHKKLGVADDRGYITFHFLGPENLSTKGTTFATRWANEKKE